MTNLTFGYDDAGNSVGLCQAKRLLLITTRGGNFSLPETAWMESGARHLQALCAMYGIPDFHLLCAEGWTTCATTKPPSWPGHGAGWRRWRPTQPGASASIPEWFRSTPNQQEGRHGPDDGLLRPGGAGAPLPYIGPGQPRQ